MKSKRILKSIAAFSLLSILLVVNCTQSINKNTISLKGKWRFQTDPEDIGIKMNWFQSKLTDAINLPGSMRDNDKGDEVTLITKWTGSIYDSSWYFRKDMAKYRQQDNLKFPFWLTPNRHYVGVAWYQREVETPAQWEGRKIELFLERPHWETTLWVDSIKIGMQNSLSTPHHYDLSKVLTPGHHIISVRVDNCIKEINVGPDSHSITDQTQGNWNGIVGNIYLKSTSPVFFDDIKLFTDIEKKSVKTIISLNNITGKDVSAKIKLSAKSFNSKTIHTVEPFVKEANVTKGKSHIEIIYPMGENVQLWDEFNPALYEMTAVLSDEFGNIDKQEMLFGMRSFSINGTRFEINNRPVFLRGTVENCVFPKTGYPPADVASWERVFTICKNYGLNHMRFHSWCPPEAAFHAADKLGFYLQVEGPSWANHGVTLGDSLPIDQYIYDETNSIENAYGNHPSFCMLAYGNEPAGRNQVEYLGKFVTYWKEKDNRRVYTSASIGRSWPLVPESEFIVRSEPRGLPWNKQPQSMFDYFERIEKYTVPYVVHEMGQYCAFPNFKEIKKYTGVYKAKNFELFQEELAKNHMGDQAEDFLMASGKLQVLCYKSEIEAALRTPNLAGIQLLSLNDYSGQGTALVGVLDAFWDAKEYISAKEFKQFLGATVPLARIPKFVFRNDETLHAEFEVAHFGSHPLNNITAQWKVTDSKRAIIAQGLLDKRDIPIDNCISLGAINLPLSQITNAEKLNLELNVGNHVNNWNFWVYPDKLPIDNNNDIYFTNKFDEKTKSILKNGGKVFLNAAGIVENGKDVIQYFRPVFWNTSWFKMRPPHTTGILCDPEHPAFAYFPTAFHSNMQWWEILDRQQVMNIDQFPLEFRPIVQPIDTWFLNRRLALLFEAQVGNGKLVVCSADLQSNLNERPAARQLFFSITKYMLSDKFNPKFKVEYSIIKELFEKKKRENIDFHTKQSTDDLKPKLK
ncbi:MAG: beta-glucuronidase [Ignavibacteria bacterium GWA2_35_9]|nr:MAG: beta-glucuronidase [Ignavibacteria bacterium GWA2_35_9]OGU53229.1 MAG: beta-glucuronidase [Ignavibacteria bacterium GWC2_36_12]